jgi:hypothetical protein
VAALYPFDDGDGSAAMAIKRGSISSAIPAPNVIGRLEAGAMGFVHDIPHPFEEP